MTASVQPTSGHTGVAALVTLPADGGSLAADLLALVAGWSAAGARRPGDLTCCDLSASASEELDRDVDRAVDQCLAALLQRARDRGEQVPLRPTWIAVRTVRGLLVSRLLGRPVDPAQVPDLVGRVLLPLLGRGLHTV